MLWVMGSVYSTATATRANAFLMMGLCFTNGKHSIVPCGHDNSLKHSIIIARASCPFMGHGGDCALDSVPLLLLCCSGAHCDKGGAGPGASLGREGPNGARAQCCQGRSHIDGAWAQFCQGRPHIGGAWAQDCQGRPHIGGAWAQCCQGRPHIDGA